jgi:hypothetical protein
MFSLTDDDLQLRILGCADGPASFNLGRFIRGRPTSFRNPQDTFFGTPGEVPRNGSIFGSSRILYEFTGRLAGRAR